MINKVASSEIEKIESIANLLDSKFQIPGTKFKFGIDPILGLIPFVGEIISFIISGLLVFVLARHGTSRKVFILMTLNILIDAAIGSIPVAGHIFDFFFKANKKNIKLLREHYSEGKHTGSGNGILIMIALAIFFILGLIMFGTYSLISWLIHIIPF